jgi:signal transduction histidine kinase
VHPEDRDVTAASWEMALAGADARADDPGRERFQVEHRLRRRDGVHRAMRARAVPVRGDDGRVREWVGVHADITAEAAARAQREALIAALERSNRDLDQFAYVASHDLKAPLRGISNLSTWIEEDLDAVMTPETREQMALLRGRVQRMEALIDGVLQYARAGRARAAPERVDVGALVREAAELLAPPAGARVEVADDLPPVVAERVPLQQVFLNLVGNALKYAGRPDAVVRVGWRAARPGWPEFWVADNGPGIAPEYHERVFGIFQTLQSRDRVEGTGIGLSVVKKIVEGQGGRVWVESAAGAGATFRFTWPSAPAGAEAPPGPAPARAAPATAA